jgi:hypothetical protein
VIYSGDIQVVCILQSTWHTCSYLHHEQFKTLCVNNMSCCPLLVFYFVSMILWIWRDLTLSCSSWNFSHITKLQSRHSNLISIVSSHIYWIFSSSAIDPIKVVSHSDYRTVYGELYSIQHYVINFVSNLQQVGGFLWYSGCLQQ